VVSVLGERQLRLGRERVGSAAVRVHFVDFGAFWIARSTLGTYRVHFVDLARWKAVRSTF
jgi:hypothetical protein